MALIPPLSLSGTFLQPYLGGNWSEKQWDDEFRYMKEIGMHQLILQWSADSQHFTAAYPTSLPGFKHQMKADVVEEALKRGGRYGFEIYVGLHLNHDWFGKYTSDPAWLDHEADLASALARDLWSKYGHYASFTGWYLSFEPDNVNQPEVSDWDQSIAFYRKVGGVMKSLTPDKPIMVAPFFVDGAGQTPKQWGTMWTYILTHSPIDIVNLQDGVGAAHSLPEHLPAWFSATKEALERLDRPVALWSDTETFRTVNGKFAPVEFAPVYECMELVAPFISNITCFSFNHYVSPQQVDPIYYESYKRVLQAGGRSK
ncbi:DUF4434 domain-containing protein [Paenibacillus spongiae]|uniref:DUF4434 domain-containing protein n=1 Tax=Paenibacillus spongiae TaxID=2909671 RepID=A0ABY5SD87_9BACL|nr:DUF4434 domain-containing protein [Paenibacillus spongiae]UVI31508.1 DUF4434 domain-containing protein [Paenibacillus spongiae]